MRFETYSQRDTPDRGDMDQAFIGIDMTRDKPLLAPGYISRGENTRLRTGRVRQRFGTAIPSDFNIQGGFENSLIGSGVFRNPNSEEVLLVAPRLSDHVWALQYGKDPIRINLDTTPPGAPGPAVEDTGNYRVRFVQAFEKVVLLRVPVINSGGDVQEVLVWDGTGDTDGDGVADTEFKVITLSANGLKLIPAQWNGEPFMDRVVYYDDYYPAIVGRDTWYLSDIEDYTSYDDVFQAFRTNPSESDFITRIMSYFRSSVVVFKNQSIHQVTIVPTFPVSAQQRILNNNIGSIGNRMPLMVGGDVLFLSQPNGFYRLSEVIQDQITTLPLPISEQIQKVIDQINWPITSSMGSSVALGNYAFFGVALGVFATRLNAVLVYDTQQRQWVSAGDTWRDPLFGFSVLHVTNYKGVQRILAIDYDESIVYLLYEGVADNVKSGVFSIPFKMETRGYVGDDPIAFKRFGRGTIGISTYDPLITVTAISDGFNEEKILTPKPITKSRTEFYPHGHKTFDPTTDDPTEPKRKDYSIINVDNNAIDDFEALPEGDITYVPGTSPVIFGGDQQESIERFSLRTFGRWMAFRIENNNGICEVTGAGVESTRAVNTGRTAA